MTTTPSLPLTDQELLQLMERASLAGITVNQLRLLLIVSLSTPESPCDSPTIIAGRMELSNAAVGEMAKILDTRKLITRKRQKEDDRKVIYKLTPAGNDLLRNIREPSKQNDPA